MNDVTTRPSQLKPLYVIQDWIANGLMTIVPFMMFFQVMLRYVFKAPLMGIEEMMWFPAIWLYMIGGAIASFKGEHITCGILTLYIKKERSMKIFNFAKTLISAIISSWLCYEAFGYFKYSLKVWKVSDTLHIPMFLGEGVLFIGIFLMVLYAFLDVYNSFMAFKSNDPAVENEIAKEGAK